MDKNTLIELAENEVFESGEFDLNPAVRNFTSLFDNESRPKISDLSEAITFYESLTEEQIKRRYSIHYWENCSLGAYDSLHSNCMEYFHRSIDMRELARRELINVQILLNEGKYKILPSIEHFLIDEIPTMFEKLVTGTWSDFFVAEELESFEIASEEHGQIFINQMGRHFEIHKERTDESFKISVEYLEKHIEESPKYIDYFNSHWVAAMQIQGLIWYKGFLEKTLEFGSPYNARQWEWTKKSESRVKTITMNKLIRINDGYEAITKSFEAFVFQHQRNPSWTDLINFMLEKPPNGIIVTGIKKGSKVVELNIEGVEKPIDREALPCSPF